MLVSAGIMKTRLTCLSPLPISLKRKNNKHQSARLLLNTRPDLFCLPAVKPKDGAKRSRAAPRLTRCADSLCLVSSIQSESGGCRGGQGEKKLAFLTG